MRTVFSGYTSILACILAFQFFISFFVFGITANTINWQSTFELLLLTFAVAPVIALGKIDIAVNNMAVFLAMLIGACFSNANLGVWGMIFVPLLVLVIILSIRPSNRLFWINIKLMLAAYLLLSGYGVFVITKDLLITIISCLVSVSVLVVYYLLVVKDRNSLIGSLAVYFLLDGLIEIIFMNAKQSEFIDNQTIKIVTDDLLGNTEYIIVFVFIWAFLLLIQSKDMYSGIKLSRVSSEDNGYIQRSMAYFESIYPNIPILKLIGEFFLSINENLKFIKAIGSNRETAGRYGIDISGYIAYAFLVSFAFIFFVSMLTMSRAMGIGVDSFANYNLLAIALAVISGAKLEGGVIMLYRIPMVVLIWQLLDHILRAIQLANITYLSQLITVLVGVATVLILAIKSEEKPRFLDIRGEQKRGKKT